MKPRQFQQGKAPLDLIEEALHLLRLAPAFVLLTYYIGALPFVLGLLYFWTDMSRSSFAEQRLPAAAVMMTFLFVWMKLWQSVFAQQVLARVCASLPSALSWPRLGRAALIQAVLQPSGLFLLPVALVILIPFGWVYAFYQNITVLGTGEHADVRQVFTKSWKNALLWPAQNNYGLIILKLFGWFVFFNLITAFFAIPFLLKTLLGIETTFSRSPMAMLNTTFFAVIGALTYLCVDPLAKTFYVLRCFYGDSLRTGLDLRTELRSFSALNKLAVVALAAFLLLTPSASGATPAAESPPSNSSGAGLHSSVSSDDLGRAITETLRQREYNWRLPRLKASDSEKEKGVIATFVESCMETLRDWYHTVDRWLQKIFRWLFGNRFRSRPDGGSLGWVSGVQWLLFLLLVALAAILGVMLIRAWQLRRRRPDVITAQPVQVLPNVADENVGAEQLPEDGWLTMARDLLDRGELRLALRAFYLSSLAHLAEKNLVNLARFKSNRDYERELARRSHALSELTQTFSENVGLFDRAWYGLHEVTRDTLDHFAQNVERIKAAT